MGRKGQNQGRRGGKQKQKQNKQRGFMVSRDNREKKMQERTTKRQKRAQRNKELKNKWRDNMNKFKAQLAQFGLVLKEVNSDGNCLFRAMADQLEGNEFNHKKYRAEIVEFMIGNSKFFEPFIEDDETFEDYIKDIRKDGIWGGHLEIQAYSMKYQVNAFIHMLEQPAYVIQNFPPNLVRTAHFTYHLGEHYNSVRLNGDIGDKIPDLIPFKLTPIAGNNEDMANKEEEKAPSPEIPLNHEAENQIFKKNMVEEEFKEEKKDKQNEEMENIEDKEQKMSTEEILEYAMNLLMCDTEQVKNILHRAYNGIIPSSQTIFEDLPILQVYLSEIESKCNKFPIEKVEGDGENINMKGGYKQLYTPSHYKTLTLTKSLNWIEKKGRGSKCHCGSGRKYRNCCLEMDTTRTLNFIQNKELEDKMKDTSNYLQEEIKDDGNKVQELKMVDSSTDEDEAEIKISDIPKILSPSPIIGEEIIQVEECKVKELVVEDSYVKEESNPPNPLTLDEITSYTRCLLECPIENASKVLKRAYRTSIPTEECIYNDLPILEVYLSELEGENIQSNIDEIVLMQEDKDQKEYETLNMQLSEELARKLQMEEKSNCESNINTNINKIDIIDSSSSASELLPNNYKNMIISKEGRWGNKSGGNHKCTTCKSGRKYKCCCKIEDEQRTNEYIRVLKGQDMHSQNINNVKDNINKEEDAEELRRAISEDLSNINVDVDIKEDLRRNKSIPGEDTSTYTPNLPNNYQNMTLTVNLKWTSRISKYKMCHCGSGNKYKSCCWEEDNERTEKYITHHITKPPITDIPNNNNQINNNEDKELINEESKEEEKVNIEFINEDPQFTQVPPPPKKEPEKYVLGSSNNWIKPPSRNKKCYCNSLLRYKLCCLDEDQRRTKEYYERIRNAVPEGIQPVNIQGVGKGDAIYIQPHYNTYIIQNIEQQRIYK